MPTPKALSLAGHFPGESFAWMEGILLLATLAQKWKLRLKAGHPVVLDPLFTLRPKFGLKMVAEKR